MPDHGEFRFEGFLQRDGTCTPTPVPPVQHTVAIGSRTNPGETAIAAARLANQIKPRPVAEWKQAIADAPESLRECLREYLACEYRARQSRAKVEQERAERAKRGKKSSAGDEALATLSKKFGGR